MKKSAFIWIGLIVLGFVFEYLYLWSDSIFFDVKFAILGVVSLIAGVLGLMGFVILPYLGANKKG